MFFRTKIFFMVKFESFEHMCWNRCNKSKPVKLLSFTFISWIHWFYLALLPSPLFCICQHRQGFAWEYSRHGFSWSDALFTTDVSEWLLQAPSPTAPWPRQAAMVLMQLQYLRQEIHPLLFSIHPPWNDCKPLTYILLLRETVISATSPKFTFDLLR